MAIICEVFPLQVPNSKMRLENFESAATTQVSRSVNDASTPSPPMKYTAELGLGPNWLWVKQG
ncbi:MAG: hypothetical protein VX879_02175 [Pseudomonadota bacterium]|nr:hypothetical protein [Rhodospirillaceae bacterium]MEC7972346.1 hypothetical protein [Pseudomonadota bacterium]MEC9044489.1 hypothetical protein [Pseudomonadota bacterium]